MKHDFIHLKIMRLKNKSGLQTTHCNQLAACKGAHPEGAFMQQMLLLKQVARDGGTVLMRLKPPENLVIIAN